MSTRSVGFWVEHPMDIALHSAPKEQVTFTCPRPKCKHKFAGTPKQILEAYRDHVIESDHVFELEDCGSCGCQHFPEFTGDCREDWERF